MQLRRSRRHDGHPRYAPILASLALAAGLAAWAPPAFAQEPLPEDNAGTGQYVEPVPDAEGDRPAAPRPGGGPGGSGTPGSGGGSGGDEQRILDRIAGDPGSGAPSGGGSGAGGDGGSGAGDGSSGSGDDRVKAADASDDDEGPVSALTSAAFDSETPAVAIILLAVLGMALVGMVIRSRRSS